MPAKIIVVCNQKGGPGKTTVTMQVAGTIGTKRKTLVIDADPQATSMRWFSMADDDNPFPATVISLSDAGEKVHQGIKRFIHDYDYIFVDCPPADDSPIPKSALLVADLALIPVRPNPVDLWATLGIKKTVDEISVINETLKARLVLNQCQPNLVLTRDVLSVLPKIEIETLKTQIQLRTAYSTSAGTGTTVHKLNGTSGKDKKAISEIIALSKEILAVIKK